MIKSLNITRTCSQQQVRVFHSATCTISCRHGSGLFALVPIAYPERHREHFLALEQFMYERHNIVVDSSCKDVCRLRGYSYDPDYYINENALVYKDILEPPTTSYSNQQALSHDYFQSDDTFRKAMEIIVMYQLDITGDYSQWFPIMCGIANEFGENGRSVAHAVSMYSPKYDEDACHTVYTDALKNQYGYTIGTFYHYFKQYFVTKPP